LTIRPLLLWCLFFLVCLGLGYPTLNRYDPASTPGLSDSADYFRMSTGHADQVGGHRRFRVLVPALAGPVYRALEGHTGTWNALSLAFLLVTSSFTAAAAVLLAGAGRIVTGRYDVGLVAALLFLLNFVTPNSLLAGSVDSAELLGMLLVTRALLADSWWWLPVIAIPAAMAKETFLPLAAVFAASWLLLTPAGDRQLGRRMVPWLATITAGALAIGLVHRSISGTFAWPWDVAASVKRYGSYFGEIWRCVSDRGFWYVFVWLLPLGLVRLPRIGIQWAGASVLAAFAAVALGAWNASEGNVARAVFNVLGPALTVAASLLLVPTSRRVPKPKD
jgi:hypothetical protein